MFSVLITVKSERVPVTIDMTDVMSHIVITIKQLIHTALVIWQPRP